MNQKHQASLLPEDPSQWSAPEKSKPTAAQHQPVDARGACWNNRVLQPLDLRQANLCRIDIRGTDLSACLLEGCNLTLARYDRKTRVPAGFDLEKSGAVGPGAALNGAFLNGADLRGMDLRHTNFMGAYLSGCDLSGAVLDGTRFVGADLRFAKLQGCRCIATRFTGSQIQQADFRAADLTEAILDGAESIQGADFSQVTGLDKKQLTNLLTRSHMELDCWNPLTRQATRTTLESLLGSAEQSA
ncbi:pentapeptide repeat-containing protein [Cyanobium sp. BA5m-21]|uniref:pentapeptide repeat-containing protein n=1 Tax=unclassified Cyanobium TaxID=2627006 RepID=UPI0020CDAC94|nr:MULTISPECIES: pentapeptide repeat-containing protein [unclassified Cyanobium]MCP9904339.1 pentapeptide repeat-containing protein [Cyanobium sp. BA5m-10]MCP9907527.1 pentapeptide repeat-containing protein [Cyanobium sp. BA5m-21]